LKDEIQNDEAQNKSTMGSSITESEETTCRNIQLVKIGQCLPIVRTADTVIRNRKFVAVVCCSTNNTMCINDIVMYAWFVRLGIC